MFSYAYGRFMQIIKHPDYELILSFRLTGRGGSKEDGWDNSLKYFCLPEEVKVVEKIHLSFAQYWMFALIYGKQLINKITGKKEDARVGLQERLNRNGIYSSYASCNLKQWDTDRKNIYLRGRFEAYEYFDEIKDVLIREFMPKEDKLEKNKELYDIIENRESVCVSVRRGDFLAEGNEKFNVCDAFYFEEAMRKIKAEIPDAVFVVFSDDIESVKQSIHFPESVWFEDGTDPVWEKLRMMYSCKHFIISNSTFSWWAQYLSRNNNKIVYAPQKWRLEDEDCSGLYLPYMRKL